MTDSDKEMAFLDSVVPTYVTSENHQDRLIRTLAMRTLAPHMRPGGQALEFGCSDGFMTRMIAEHVKRLTVVDGSKKFIDTAKRDAPVNVDFVHSLFEDFDPDERYDYVFATWVLEHVRNAVGFLHSASRLLTDDGLLFVVVPNARALSRQLARHMGLLDDLFALTPNDVNHGHRRVYDRVLLDRALESAGVLQIGQGGLLLKLLADFQMDELIKSGVLGESQLEGLYKMGLEYPDFAGSLFSICRRPSAQAPVPASTPSP